MWGEDLGLQIADYGLRITDYRLRIEALHFGKLSATRQAQFKIAD
jgi:hypothetical protein